MFNFNDNKVRSNFIPRRAEKIDEYGKIVYDLCKYSDFDPENIPDYIILGGEDDIRTASFAYEMYNVYKKYNSNLKIIAAGGKGVLTSVMFKDFGSEADTLAYVLKELGFPEEDLIIQNESTNTGENVTFTIDKINEEFKKGNTSLNFENANSVWILPPRQSKRFHYTLNKQLQDKNYSLDKQSITYPDFPYEDSVADFNCYDLENIFIDAIVGNAIRFLLYPEKGYHTELEEKFTEKQKEAMFNLIEQGIVLIHLYDEMKKSLPLDSIKKYLDYDPGNISNEKFYDTLKDHNMNRYQAVFAGVQNRVSQGKVKNAIDVYINNLNKSKKLPESIKNELYRYKKTDYIER